MKTLSFWIFPLGLITAGLLSWSCISTSIPAAASGGNNPVSPATIIVTNNSPIAVNINMDGGSYYSISAGGSRTFSSSVNGTHVFASQAAAHVSYNGACSGDNTVQSCTSGVLSQGNQYTINVTGSYCSSCSCSSGTGEYYLSWSCP